jgi:SAM-dependent methyltransferase
MAVEWGLAPQPEWFDHCIDLYYQWHQERNPLWLERGCFNLLALRDQGKILELCCGDGFNACHFYSLRAEQVIAVDFDPRAIEHARQVNAAPNVLFEVCDIRRQMPQGSFDNIIWDAAIEHFTPVEIETVIRTICARLGKNGILSGYTIVERQNGKHLSHHEYEFKSKEDLMRFLVPYFKKVKVFETKYPSRHNLYFYASDGLLPFDPDWDAQVTFAKT